MRDGSLGAIHQKEKRIHIIGGANVDVIGGSPNELAERDSNIGKIRVSFGGVGRNIAHTTASLGAPTRFVTCFGADVFGRLLREDCERCGIDCGASIESETFPSSMYLALLEKDGDMRIGMSDMRILSEMREETLDAALEDIGPEDILVIDSNLEPRMIRYIADGAPCRVAADPVSAAKAGHLSEVIPELSIFTPNRIEAEALSGIAIDGEDAGRAALNHFLSLGVEEILITMAGEGVLLGTREGLRHFTHHPPAVFNATGGGDVFLGAYLVARLAGVSPAEATRFAIGAAVIRIETTDEEELILTEENIRRRLETLGTEEKEL